jgi:hypothetical protein
MTITEILGPVGRLGTCIPALYLIGPTRLKGAVQPRLGPMAYTSYDTDGSMRLAVHSEEGKTITRVRIRCLDRNRQPCGAFDQTQHFASYDPIGAQIGGTGLGWSQFF